MFTHTRSDKIHLLIEEILILPLLGHSVNLMGGVLIVYERKVKLLGDDLNRLLVEINEAWEVKPTHALDPTVLLKGKNHAKNEAVTVPENEGTGGIGDIEQSLNFSNTNANVEHQIKAYFAMRLNGVQVQCNNDNGKYNDATQQFHPVYAANFTLPGRIDGIYQMDTAFNCFKSEEIWSSLVLWLSGILMGVVIVYEQKKVKVVAEDVTRDDNDNDDDDDVDNVDAHGDADDADDGPMDYGQVEDDEVADQVGQGEVGGGDDEPPPPEDGKDDDDDHHHIYADEEEEEEVDDEELEKIRAEIAALDIELAMLDNAEAVLAAERAAMDPVDPVFLALDDNVDAALDRFEAEFKTDPNHPNLGIALAELEAAQDALNDYIDGIADRETCHPPAKAARGPDGGYGGGGNRGKRI